MTAKTKESTDVALKNNTSNLPAEFLADMTQDAGMGVSTDPNEVGIPFLYILQDLSPQVKKRDPAYIDGAEVGDIYNNISKEVISAARGIDFIPCGFESAQVEWKPDRGGFAGKHPHDTPLRSQVKQTQVGDKMVPMLPNGNVLTETKYHYGFYRASATETEAAGMWEPCVIGMASSMIKNSREFEGMKKRVLIPGTDKIAPSFSTVYNFSTVVVKKNNNEWFVWEIKPLRWVDGNEYNKGRDFAQAIIAGSVKTSEAATDGGVAEGQYTNLDEEVI